MDFIAKNANTAETSEPIFLGYKSMNPLGFLSKAGIDNDYIVNYLNANLNKIQKKRKADFDFGKTPTYINEYDEIMIPQYGVKKLVGEGEYSGIKKQDGGDISVPDLRKVKIKKAPSWKKP
jgi:hypothetical protein